MPPLCRRSPQPLPNRILDIVRANVTPPSLRLIEVGAAATEPASPYDPLVAAGIAEVLAFDPDPAACAELLALHPTGWTIVQEALGDGGELPFHLCRSPFCSSLYPPDMELARLFTGLAEFHEPVGRATLATHRLDDVEPARGASWLAVDAQGAELTILENGVDVLRTVLVARLEVQFVPLYHGAPGFGEIDRFMQAQGFVLHTFESLGTRCFAPVVLNGDIGQGLKQMLWADAVYVRDFRKLDELSDDDLLRLAILAGTLVGSFDLAHLAVARYDRRHATQLTRDFQAAVQTMRAA